MRIKSEIIDKIYKNHNWQYNFNLYPKCKKCGQIILRASELPSSTYNSFNELFVFTLKLPLCSKCKIEEFDEAYLTLMSYRIGRYGILRAIKEDLANKYLSYYCCQGSDFR